MILIFSVSAKHGLGINSDVDIPDYNIYRKDRDGASGGGVFIYIEKHFTVKIKKDLMSVRKGTIGRYPYHINGRSELWL